MKTLYVTDLDGTLLNADSQVSTVSRQIINDLTARGAWITAATARTPATFVPLMDGVVTTPPAIVMTGAALWNRQECRYEDVHYISADDVDLVMATCHAEGVDPFVYRLSPQGMINSYHESSELNSQERKFLDLRRDLALKRFHIGEGAPADTRGNTVLLFGLGPEEAIMRAGAALRGLTECVYTACTDYLNPEMGMLELFAPGVDKASAVRNLKRRMGADRLVVFGDNINDLPMLSEADVAVAVANAVPQVRERADIVIGPNTDDSVARFILTDFNDFQ